MYAFDAVFSLGRFLVSEDFEDEKGSDRPKGAKFRVWPKFGPKNIAKRFWPTVERNRNRHFGRKRVFWPKYQFKLVNFSTAREMIVVQEERILLVGRVVERPLSWKGNVG